MVFMIKSAAPSNPTMEAIKENFSETIETPPMISRNESELLTDIPAISFESCDFTRFNIKGSFSLKYIRFTASGFSLSNIRVLSIGM